ncbi:hypothetical protein C2G38_2033331 [Gigaspora rosea]|uniref:Uncharacterized protein n=1 Tax=Gigaspora rosea TaxID=44941 RepID=A0A397VJR7_9GLOM|nr:hypothetical protein C2G38_2033331 [Gigaspora rosea]
MTKKIKHALDRTRPTTAAQNKMSDYKNKNKTKGKKKVKFVDSPVVANFDNKSQEVVLTKKLRPVNEKLEGREYGVSVKKRTSEVCSTWNKAIKIELGLKKQA